MCFCTVYEIISRRLKKLKRSVKSLQNIINPWGKKNENHNFFKWEVKTDTIWNKAVGHMKILCQIKGRSTRKHVKSSEQRERAAKWVLELVPISKFWIIYSECTWVLNLLHSPPCSLRNYSDLLLMGNLNFNTIFFNKHS